MENPLVDVFPIGRWISIAMLVLPEGIQTSDNIELMYAFRFQSKHLCHQRFHSSQLPSCNLKFKGRKSVLHKLKSKKLNWTLWSKNLIWIQYCSWITLKGRSPYLLGKGFQLFNHLRKKNSEGKIIYTYYSFQESIVETCLSARSLMCHSTSLTEKKKRATHNFRISNKQKPLQYFHGYF